MKSEAAIRQALREWIASRNGSIDPAALQDDTPLLERRILSSLVVIELIVFIESLREEPIDVKRLKSGTFRDLNSICAAFFGETNHGS